MGVSKAIINSVLFCHQDDSNWPLDEGKKLKEKFDAIFGTTEYNRAIERLIKLAKLYSDKQKEKQGDLKLLRHLKEEALVKNQEVTEKDVKLNKFQDELQSITDLEIPIKSRIQEIIKIMQNISTLNGKQIEMETKYDINIYHTLFKEFTMPKRFTTYLLKYVLLYEFPWCFEKPKNLSNLNLLKK